MTDRPVLGPIVQHRGTIFQQHDVRGFELVIKAASAGTIVIMGDRSSKCNPATRA